MPKKGAYLTTLALDPDGDGEADVHEDGYIYDFRLEHARRHQAISVRTVLLSAIEARKDVDVLARDYLEDIAGSAVAYVSLERNGGAVFEKRFATHVLGEQSLLIADRPAHVVMLEVANVDQLTLNPADRLLREAFVFIRTGYARASHGQRGTGSFPVLMVVAYSSYPEDFEQGLPDFEQLLAHVSLHQPPSQEYVPATIRKTASATASVPVTLFRALLNRRWPHPTDKESRLCQPRLWFRQLQHRSALQAMLVAARRELSNVLGVRRDLLTRAFYFVSRDPSRLVKLDHEMVLI